MLDYTSTDAAKFTLFNAATGKSVQNWSTKGNTNSLSTKPKLLEKGQYYLEVQSTNAKKGGYACYTVAVDDRSLIYTKGDTTDDAPDKAKNLGAVTTKPKMLVNNEWVGVGDEFDYRKFTLNSGAKLNFTVNASDAVKFTVYQQGAKGKLKALGNVNVKAGATANTKDIFAEKAGTYYFSVQSTKAKKDGNADYTVTLNDNSKFFTDGDNTNDTWKAASEQEAKLPGEEITGWVGFGDAADFIKFEVEEDGKIQLNLDPVTADALASKQIKLTCLNEQGKSVALGKLTDGIVFSKKNVSEGEYYLGVTCANVKKYDTSYSITTGQLA